MAKLTLVSWIGNTDFRALAKTLPEAKAAKVMEEAKQARTDEKGDGPLKTLVDNVSFDEIHLLSNFSEATNSAYKKWIGKNVTLHSVTMQNVSDHAEVFQAVKPILESLARNDRKLCFHLSPGTPAMAAIWVLLGKSLYPATLYQTYGGRVSTAEIPFDITVDVITDLLKQPDRVWQHLNSEKPGDIEGFKSIVGESDVVRAVVGRAKRAAMHDVPVLILGESGTGKELFAAAIHKASHRRNKEFRIVNCAALPDQLLESELFGHVKGAFTDAKENRKGLLEVTNGGTLFLDEVGECSLLMQAKLLRVLQPPEGGGPCDRKFSPVGGTKEIVTDVRIVAATNRDLVKRAQEGLFREDLIYRLATITLKLPPLRQRGADVALIAEALLKQVNEQFERQHGVDHKHKTLSADAKSFVLKHQWPGNVRQLRNVLVQAAVMAPSPVLTAEDLEAAMSDFPGMEPATNFDPPLGNGFNIEDHLHDIRKRFIRRALKEAENKKTAAAELLGMNNYQTLSQQMERYSIDIR